MVLELELNNRIQAARIDLADNLSCNSIPRSGEHLTHPSPQHASSEWDCSCEKIRRMLSKVIVKAKRAGAWKRISPIERGIMTLAANLQIRFRSISLLRAIVKIVRQISERTSFAYQNCRRGVCAVYRMAEYAAEAGYGQARKWTEDRHFMIWWGIFLNPHTYTR